MKSGGGDGDGDEGGDQWGKTPETPNDLGWDVESSWSTGLTKDHFDGEAVGRQIDSTAACSEGGGPPRTVLREIDELDSKLAELEL